MSAVIAFMLAGLGLLPPRVLGDGAIISATALEKVQIPDQRALIHFARGQETLVIDTAFKGKGTNFAWLIPVPSVPTVEPATPGLFTTLQTIFQPRIVHDPFALYWVEGFVGLLIAWILWKQRRGQPLAQALIEVLGCLILLSVLLGLFLPALAGAKASASAGASGEPVRVVERKRIGVYDTATLVSRDGQALFDWLKQNGFVVRTNFIPVIRAYAQEGWCFLASKIRLETPMSDAANAHPLALTFKTDRPVYPLRLTGIDNPSCRIELYLFGPSRAELPGFQVERCGAPAYPDASASSGSRIEGLRIRHPLLRRLVAGSPAATKLVGLLKPGDMREDAYVTWTPLRETRLTRYSVQGAAITAANITVPVLLLGFLGWLGSYWARERAPGWARSAGKVSRLVILAALVGWGGIYLGLPKTQVVVSRFPRKLMWHFHHRLIPDALGHRATEQGLAKLDARWVRQQLAETSEFRRGLSRSLQINPFTGEPWREEDSPGNYTIRETPEGIEYVWYDLEGNENPEPLFP